MFQRSKSLVFIFVLFTMACQQNTRQPGATEEKKLSLEDSLYKAVIAFHDEVMPQMGKVQGYQKTVQAKIDSLTTTLANKKDETGHELKARYEVLLSQLKSAEQGMNNWMD